MIPNQSEEKSGIFCPVRKNSFENCMGQKILWDVFGCLLATKNMSLETLIRCIQSSFLADVNLAPSATQPAASEFR